MKKNLYIISGCNGAGKTTASYTVLPEILDCKEFVNADEIARGLSPFNPESVAIQNWRYFELPRECLKVGITYQNPSSDEDMLLVLVIYFAYL
jgi:predicted ABC-type ATPase